MGAAQAGPGPGGHRRGRRGWRHGEGVAVWQCMSAVPRGRGAAPLVAPPEGGGGGEREAWPELEPHALTSRRANERSNTQKKKNNWKVRQSCTSTK